MTYSNLVNYTFVSRIETFIFFFLSDPSRIWKLLVSVLFLFSWLCGYLLNTVRICPPVTGHNWKHWSYYQGSDENVMYERDMNHK